MRRILFLASGDRPNALSEPERYAYAWAADRPGLAVRLTPFDRAGGEGADLLWWHAAGPLSLEKVPLATIGDRVSAGTPLLLTGVALKALPELGLEEKSPRVAGGDPYGGETGEQEMRGHMTFAGHPAFSAFGTGAYTWKPRRGLPIWDAWYDREEGEPRGRVIAVERRYIAFDPRIVTALTYDLGSGTVGAVGAHLHFHDRRNPFRGHLERLVEGWIRWLASEVRGAAAAAGHRDDPFVYAGFVPDARERPWPRPVPGLLEEPPDPLWAEAGPSDPLPPPAHDALDRLWREPPPGGLTIASEGPEDAFFDLSGQRHFLLGRACSGLSEAWTGGVRLFGATALRWHAAASEEPSGSVLLDDAGGGRLVSAETRLDGYRRIVHAGGEGGREGEGVTVRQHLVVHPEAPGGLALLEVTSGRGGVLTISVDLDLRLMWPYPAGLLNPLRASRPGGGVVAVRGTGLDAWGALALAGPEGPGSWEVAALPQPAPSGEAEHTAARLTGRVALPGGRYCVLLAWSVDRSGLRPVAGALRRLVEEHLSICAFARMQVDRQARRRVTIETPGRRFGEAFNWAANRMDTFHFSVDGLGTSYLAGFGESGAGWLAARPGYAWFFGRDAVFTALGALALGEQERAWDVLQFLAAHQEWSGKILHEATLSGAVHYDAADATPLWLVLLGAWYRATGDTLRLKELWPAAKRAMAFCRRTDRDGDGLIENTGVGHGWIEGGTLHGAHVTNYLAGVWAAALDAFAECAGALGERSEAREMHGEAERVRLIYEELFWVEPSEGTPGHYGLGLRRDRTLQPDHTVMPTVPIALGRTDPGRARDHLVPLSSEAFTADWGVRMIARDHPDFDPEGYHSGSIWPLYTGWTALAEYRTDRHEAAFAHLQGALHTVFDMCRGGVEEVLHGLRYEHAGVCGHQAWSHAVLLQAAVEGMVGWRPDARPGRWNELSPVIPEDWEALEVRGLRSGDHRLDLRMEGSPGRRVWRLQLDGAGGSAQSLRLRFRPAMPPETRVEEVIVDGRHLHAIDRPGRDLRRVEMEFDLEAGHPVTVEIRYVFDLVPVLPPPDLELGRPSRAWRLVDRWWEGADRAAGRLPGSCRMILEGPPGSEAIIDCLLPGRRPKEVEGAAWVAPPRRGMGRLRVPFPAVEIPAPGCSRDEGGEHQALPPCYVPTIVRIAFG